jgi:hypothetical protein
MDAHVVGAHVLHPREVAPLVKASDHDPALLLKPPTRARAALLVVVDTACRRRFRADRALQELFSDFSLTEKHKRKILKTPPYLPYLP